MVYKCQHNLSLADIASLTILTTEASTQQSVLAQHYFLTRKLSKRSNVFFLFDKRWQTQTTEGIHCFSLSLWKPNIYQAKSLEIVIQKQLKSLKAKMAMSIKNVFLLFFISSSAFLPPSALHQYWVVDKQNILYERSSV